MTTAQLRTPEPEGGVLIVEDSEIFRNLLKYGLESRYPGVRILEAGNVSEGENLAKTHLPAVILMDVQLPDGNGLDLTKTLKDEIPGLHVIVCTAHDLPEHREAAVRCGAAHFVSKDRLAELGFMEMVGRLLQEGPAPTLAKQGGSSFPASNGEISP
jgi:DNA-binding NarL/FixJ family response regulator